MVKINTKKQRRKKKNNYTRKQKKEIADEMLQMTENDVLTDFKKLKEIGCEYHKELSQMGNQVVNYYTLVERLNARGKQGINFYDIWKNQDYYKKLPSVKNILDYYKKNNGKYPKIKVWFRITNLYFSAISIFKPLIAMDIYCKFKPKSILDFTMGWGGRLVGACALDVKKYTGIDFNKGLKMPYQKMKKFLKKHSKTDINLYFQDALTFDYSKLDYDLVLTSPPYYNIEVYGKHSQILSKEKWDNDFYIPIITKTFKYLKKEDIIV